LFDCVPWRAGAEIEDANNPYPPWVGGEGLFWTDTVHPDGTKYWNVTQIWTGSKFQIVYVNRDDEFDLYYPQNNNQCDNLVGCVGPTSLFDLPTHTSTLVQLQASPNNYLPVLPVRAICTQVTIGGIVTKVFFSLRFGSLQMRRLWDVLYTGSNPTATSTNEYNRRGAPILSVPWPSQNGKLSAVFWAAFGSGKRVANEDDLDDMDDDFVEEDDDFPYDACNTSDKRAVNYLQSYTIKGDSLTYTIDHSYTPPQINFVWNSAGTPENSCPQQQQQYYNSNAGT